MRETSGPLRAFSNVVQAVVPLPVTGLQRELVCAAGWHEADWEERGVRCLGMEGKGEAKQKKTCNFKAILKLWLRAQPIRFVQGFPRGHSTPLPWRAGCEPYLGGPPAPLAERGHSAQRR